MLEEQRILYQKYGEEFVSFESTLNILGIKSSAEITIVDFAELTYMQRSNDATGQPRPEYGYDYLQSATFVLAESGWLLDSISSKEAPPATALPDAEALAARDDGTFDAAMSAALEINQANIVTPDEQALMSSGANNGLVQAYALQYWNFYNPDYPRVQENDCTNFVSQALRYAGWTEVTGFYQNPDAWWWGFATQTYTWVNAQMLADFGVYVVDRFLATDGSGGWVVGDIAFWIWDGVTWHTYDHASVVTAVDGLGNPYFTQHTADRLNESLAAYYGREPALWVADYHNK